MVVVEEVGARPEKARRLNGRVGGLQLDPPLCGVKMSLNSKGLQGRKFWPLEEVPVQLFPMRKAGIIIWAEDATPFRGSTKKQPLP